MASHEGVKNTCDRSAVDFSTMGSPGEFAWILDLQYKMFYWWDTPTKVFRETLLPAWRKSQTNSQMWRAAV